MRVLAAALLTMLLWCGCERRQDPPPEPKTPPVPTPATLFPGNGCGLQV
jgi:hypothetical protein